MERKKLTIRIKKNIYDRFNLLKTESGGSKQNLIDEILELGLLEKMKGGLSNDENILGERDRNIKEQSKCSER